MTADDEIERFSRHLLFPGFTEEHQGRLKASRVFIAGAGGLGSPASIYIAVAGIGSMTICDPDSVSVSNLNRQILHAENRLGMNKAESAVLTLNGLSSRCAVAAVSERITGENARALIRGHDIVIDCLDSFSARMILASAAFQEGIPYMHGGVSGTSGQAGLFDPPRTACLGCLIAGAADSDRPEPIFGATAGIIGSIEALEAVRFLSGLGSPLYGSLLVIDGSTYECHRLSLEPTPGCPVCGTIPE